MRTCKSCPHAIPDADMGAYECGVDHGLRYGYQGCDEERTKKPEGEHCFMYLAVAMLSKDLETGGSTFRGGSASDAQRFGAAYIIAKAIVDCDDFIQYLEEMCEKGQEEMVSHPDLREKAEAIAETYSALLNERE